MKATMKSMRKNNGFTLLELILVLTMVAILLGWGLPSVRESIRNNTVLAQSNELIALMHFTKSEALRRNTDVPIVLTAGDSGWSAIVEDPAEAADVEGCVPGQLRCTSHDDVILTTDVAQVNYNNRGYIRSEDDAWTTETLFVQHTECSGNFQRRRIDITPTGQISSCTLPCDSEAVCP